VGSRVLCPGDALVPLEIGKYSGINAQVAYALTVASCNPERYDFLRLPGRIHVKKVSDF
jgi:hypothetical protein